MIAGASARPARWPPPTRKIIGIGELAVLNEPGALIVTHAIGSCIAVCIYDPVAKVAGMLHFLLPDSRINPARARQQPQAFADTGIPLLFQTAYELGLNKRRAIVRLVGGGDVAGAVGSFATGRRNALAARQVLWRNGIFVSAEDVGGESARTVHLLTSDGRLHVFSGQSHKEL